MQMDLWDPGRLIASLGFCLTQVTVLDALDAAREAFSSAVLVPPVCYTVPLTVVHR